MRSFIILEVEHGEDTDAVEKAINDCVRVIDCSEYRATVNDYTVRVDLPPYLTANNVNAALEVRA